VGSGESAVAQAAAADDGGEKGPLFHGPAVAAVRACVSSGAGVRGRTTRFRGVSCRVVITEQ
jgi:hypothetical protein